MRSSTCDGIKSPIATAHYNSCTIGRVLFEVGGGGGGCIVWPSGHGEGEVQEGVYI